MNVGLKDDLDDAICIKKNLSNSYTKNNLDIIKDTKNKLSNDNLKIEKEVQILKKSIKNLSVQNDPSIEFEKKKLSSLELEERDKEKISNTPKNYSRTKSSLITSEENRSDILSIAENKLEDFKNGKEDKIEQIKKIKNFDLGNISPTISISKHSTLELSFKESGAKNQNKKKRSQDNEFSKKELFHLQEMKNSDYDDNKDLISVFESDSSEEELDVVDKIEKRGSMTIKPPEKRRFSLFRSPQNKFKALKNIGPLPPPKKSEYSPPKINITKNSPLHLQILRPKNETSNFNSPKKRGASLRFNGTLYSLYREKSNVYNPREIQSPSKSVNFL